MDTDTRIFIEQFGKPIEQLELNLSVDCVLFTVQKGCLKVLLTQPAPKWGWMLPGGFVFKNEHLDKSAQRILQQRTGIAEIYLNQFKIFSEPSRFSFKDFLNALDEEKASYLNRSIHDFPTRVLSVGYFALVDFKALSRIHSEETIQEKTIWADVKKIPNLQFDHEEIIQAALLALRTELKLKPIVYNLLPEKFTMPELQRYYEIILDKSLDRSSFQKRMLRWDIYERLEERREGVAHKRPFLYRFAWERYKLACEKGVNFSV